MENECRYKQRAGFIASYYKCPMTLRIKALRESLGWSQEELAEKAGISRSQLAQIESEARPANTLRLNAIANALGVEVFQLFPMDADDQTLLDAAKELSQADRKTILRMALALAAQSSSSD
jgi:transcriptional regulator with XRE-family HTH domain